MIRFAETHGRKTTGHGECRSLNGNCRRWVIYERDFGNTQIIMQLSSSAREPCTVPPTAAQFLDNRWTKRGPRLEKPRYFVGS